MKVGVRVGAGVLVKMAVKAAVEVNVGDSVIVNVAVETWVGGTNCPGVHSGLSSMGVKVAVGPEGRGVIVGAMVKVEVAWFSGPSVSWPS